MRVDARRPAVAPAAAPALVALAAETPKRSAAWRRDMPPSTAATTRSRRLSERVCFDMPAGFLASKQFESEQTRFVIPFRFTQKGNQSSLHLDKAAGEVARVTSSRGGVSNSNDVCKHADRRADNAVE